MSWGWGLAFRNRKRRKARERPSRLPGRKLLTTEYLPSVDEELIEEVLRKFFTDQLLGVHDGRQKESWVKFTVSMIRRELKARGKTRSHQEVRRSLDIMARANVVIYADGDDDPIYTGSILSDMIRTNRAAYEDDGSVHWAARLPALVSKSVENHTYRQFNYGKLMQLSGPFVRYLHKRLSQRFVNSGGYHTHNIALSSLVRDSGLLTRQRISENARAVDNALDELVRTDVLAQWDKKETRGRGKRLEDVVYVMQGSQAFNKEMTAFNARHADIAAARGEREPRKLAANKPK